MNQEKFERVLESIAQRNGLTKKQVREEMTIAMEEGIRCSDPVVQQRWSQIPKRGEKLTLEEFVDYLVSQC